MSVERSADSGVVMPENDLVCTLTSRRLELGQQLTG